LLLASAFAAALLATRGAAASDGVIEINQARALAGGITSTDTPGFPVTIAESGSYRLTGDLEPSGAAGVQVVAPAKDVTVDLGGFTIRGPNVCTPQTPGVSCFLTGGPNAFDASLGGRLTVRNGSLRGMRNGLAVVAAESVTIEDLVVSHFSNSGLGVTAAIPVLVRRSVAKLNGGRGIDAGVLGRVVDCVADHNGNDGIFATHVSGSTAASNAANGISASALGGAVDGSRATGNGSAGIAVGAGGRVSDSTALANKIGVQLQAGATLLSSTIRDSTSFGFFAASSTTYGGNTLTNNNGGSGVQSSGSAEEIATNYCGADTVCP